MSSDYTKHFANQIRDSTIAGIVANIIRAQQQGVPLFQTTAIGGLAGGGGASGGACGLTFSPSALSFVIPTNDTGSVAAVVSVTSSIAQTVTFCAYWAGGSVNPCVAGSSPAPCIGAPTVTPSTVTFTAGQSVSVGISVPYTNCTTDGLTGTLSLGATTSLGCTVNNGLTGGGTVTTSNAPTFAIEASCNNVTACCGTQAGIWGSVAYNDLICEFFINGLACPGGNETQNWTMCGGQTFNFRARSINGFAGTITLTCSTPICSGCTGDSNSCVGFAASVTLTAGQTLSIPWATGQVFITCFGERFGPNSTSAGSTVLVLGVSGSISKQAFAEGFVKFHKY